MINKYLKYKIKYLNLKNKYKGGGDEDEDLGIKGEDYIIAIPDIKYQNIAIIYEEVKKVCLDMINIYKKFFIDKDKDYDSYSDVNIATYKMDISKQNFDTFKIDIIKKIKAQIERQSRLYELKEKNEKLKEEYEKKENEKKENENKSRFLHLLSGINPFKSGNQNNLSEYEELSKDEKLINSNLKNINKDEILSNLNKSKEKLEELLLEMKKLEEEINNEKNQLNICKHIVKPEIGKIYYKILKKNKGKIYIKETQPLQFISDFNFYMKITQEEIEKMNTENFVEAVLNHNKKLNESTNGEQSRYNETREAVRSFDRRPHVKFNKKPNEIK